MRNISSQNVRRSFVLSAAILACAGALLGYKAQADDIKPGDSMVVSPAARKMVVDQVIKMKDRASDADEKQKMTMEMAKMMVADRMAIELAADPQCQQACMTAVNDPPVKKVHADAVKMAQDPATMEKLQQEILSDPKEIKVVAHRALILVLEKGEPMADKPADAKSTEDKLKDLGGKIMDKIQK